MSEATVTRRTLSVLVENAAGVLSQVSRLFSRKGYNIESLAVGTTDDPTVSRITIEVMADEAMTEQIMNQLRKQFPVYSVQELKPERSIRRELVMFKVRAETPDIRNEVIQIANIFRASIIDVSLKSLTLALIGDESKADAMQKLLEAFGILELVRTGMVALERGAYTIGDETKEQTEFKRSRGRRARSARSTSRGRCSRAARSAPSPRCRGRCPPAPPAAGPRRGSATRCAPRGRPAA